MNHYYRIPDVENFKALVELGTWMENEIQNHELGGPKKKTLINLFFNSSLRTRISTQKAALNLGLDVITYNAGEAYQLEFLPGAVMKGTKAEHIKEAAIVLSQYADIIAIRSFPELKSFDDDRKDRILKGFMEYATVPILNMESCLHHPLQGLADAITIEDNKRNTRPKVVLTWAPHIKPLPLAVPISFCNAMQQMDYDFVVTHPEGYELPESVTGAYTKEYNQEKAFEGADFIYAKSWTSTKDYGTTNVELSNWKLTREKFNGTNNARFMHCLPIRRNVVASDEVLDHEGSLIYKQAKNRTYAAQAVLYKLLNA